MKETVAIAVVDQGTILVTDDMHRALCRDNPRKPKRPVRVDYRPLTPA